MPATVPGRGPFCLSFAIRPYGTRYADEIVAKAVGRKFRAHKVGRAASFWFHQAVRDRRLPAVRRRFAGVDAIRTEPAGVDRSPFGCWKILRRHIGKPSQINVCLKEKSKLSGSHRNVVISRG